MAMSALGQVVRAGVGRRRGPAVAMGLTTMLAVTASVLGVGLLVASPASFDAAFQDRHGAQLTARFDAGRVGEEQVRATARVAGVVEAAGPYRMLSLRPRAGANGEGIAEGDELAPMTIVGRADAGGAVDRLQITDGRWATGPGEVVLDADNAPFGVGGRLRFPDLPGAPTLSVVGMARSVGRSSNAWVSPAELRELTAPGARPDYQMLYRFAAAATQRQVAADREAIAAAVPAGAMTGVSSYLTLRLQADRTPATFAPFVVAFGLLGLGMSVLVIAVVVSGAVGAATRRIGVLKAIGFTPGQIVWAYTGQALIPATAGTAAGVVCGDLLAVAVLGDAGAVRGAGPAVVPPWVDVAVAGLALALVAGTALVPALRAGRLRTVEALVVGRTPRAGRGRRVRQVLGRLPLPRAVTLGLASPFSRPARASTIAAAVALGTVGVTLGVGLAVSLGAIQRDADRRSPGAIVVQVSGPPAPPVPGEQGRPIQPAGAEQVAAMIQAQPGTGRYFSTGETELSVSGLAGPTRVIAYRGASSWGAYRMLAGRWFQGPGEAVVPSGFLSATGTHLGDTITLTNGGRSASVRLVGEALAMRPVILTDAGSLAGLDAYVLPQSVEFDIDLAPGVDRRAYMAALDDTLRPYGIVSQPNHAHVSGVLVAMDALAATLTLLLVAVAGAGVLNVVVLDIRERARDIGILKSLGLAPRQAVAMVLTSVAVNGLAAGALGVPVGVALHHLVVPAMGEAAGTTIPRADIEVYHPPVLVPLLLGGLLIAVGGALVPAGWSARSGTAAALRSE
ncbi:FtsX-like permease family protein [Dactylosporangium sp. CA-139066]|uniref:ABC transporter permease n=1 Tax=Dactylosporangium sp. CA-139066 TaxID=3239930 RepID=UPI003D8F3F31